MSEPSYAFIDGMLDQIQAGESSSPVSQHLDMRLVEHSRGQVTTRCPCAVVRSGRQLIWAECDMTADGKEVGKFTATGVRPSAPTPARRAPRGTRP